MKIITSLTIAGLSGMAAVMHAQIDANSNNLNNSNSPSSARYSTNTGGLDHGNPMATRVTRDILDSKVTAKNLIGKDVHDANGRKIGAVADIVIPSAMGLSGAFADKDKNYGTSTSGSADTYTPGTTGTSTAARTNKNTGTSSSSDSTYTPGTSGGTTTARTNKNAGTSSTDSNYGTSGNVGANRNSSDTSVSYDKVHDNMGMGMGSGRIYAIISAGGFLGMGNDLIQVDLRQLAYDSSQDKITLNISESELTRVKSSTATTSVDRRRSE